MKKEYIRRLKKIKLVPRTNNSSRNVYGTITAIQIWNNKYELCHLRVDMLCVNMRNRAEIMEGAHKAELVNIKIHLKHV